MDGGNYGRSQPVRRGGAGIARLRDSITAAEHGLIERTEFTALWLIAVATYGVGDILTTLSLFYYSPTVSEGNALIAAVMHAHGPLGLVVLKLLAFGGCLFVALYAASERERLLYYATPTIVAIAGAFATAWNIRLMLG